MTSQTSNNGREETSEQADRPEQAESELQLLEPAVPEPKSLSTTPETLPASQPSQEITSRKSSQGTVFLGPSSQSRCDTPPSSQQYSSWSVQERRQFIKEVSTRRASLAQPKLRDLVEEFDQQEQQDQDWVRQYTTKLWNPVCAVIGPDTSDTDFEDF